LAQVGSPSLVLWAPLHGTKYESLSDLDLELPFHPTSTSTSTFAPKSWMRDFAFGFMWLCG